MKNIAFIVSRSEIGGAQKWLKEQAEICKSNFNVHIITNEAGWLTDSLPRGVNVYCDAAVNGRISISFIFRLVRYIKGNNIQLIVASSANAGLYSRLAAFFTACGCIYVSHGWSAVYNGGAFKFVYVFIEWLLSNITDAIICVSDKDFDDAKRIVGVREEKLHLIPNKVCPMPRKDNNHLLHVPPKGLMVSRFLHPKRPDLAISALKNESIELHFVGDGPGLDKAKALADGCSNIHFKGAVSSFDDFKHYDFFILLSDSEGTPMSALEAMSAGLPLVLSAVGGCSALISGNGALVSNDIDSIKDGVKDVLQNYAVYGERSAEIFDNRYNLLANSEEYFRLYRRYL